MPDLPVLVIFAYLADRGQLPGFAKRADQPTLSIELSVEEIGKLVADMKVRHGEDLSAATLFRLAQAEADKNGIRSKHRRAALAYLTGKAGTAGPPKVLQSDESAAVNDAVSAHPLEVTKASLSLADTRLVVVESDPEAIIGVRRIGYSDAKVSVKYRTVDGTATAGQDYVSASGLLTFMPAEFDKAIKVTIINDASSEATEFFSVELFDAKLEPLQGRARPTGTCVIEDTLGKCMVTIVDDDNAGVLSFEAESITVRESHKDTELPIKILRTDGIAGRVSVKYRTENGTALSGSDYQETKGELVFEPGQIEATVGIVIKAMGRYESNEDFRLILEEPTGGASFDPRSDGGSDSCIATVVIVADENAKPLVDNFAALVHMNYDKVLADELSWVEQFQAALYCNGSAEAQQSAGALDWLNHLLSLPFKLIYAVVPPPAMLGGWACFCTSLAFVGMTTAIVGEIAGMLGCCLGLEDSITAITFVALGTSLPDTFASKSAAIEDPFADAAVANVTGSNSVNVFLGLGLPWMIGAFYWNGGATEEWRERIGRHDMQLVEQYPNGAFVVMAGDLSFSVLVFAVCALIALALLSVRRSLYGGELGGPKGPKYASGVGLVALWFIYISASIYKTMTSPDAQVKGAS